MTSGGLLSNSSETFEIVAAGHFEAKLKLWAEVTLELVLDVEWRFVGGPIMHKTSHTVIHGSFGLPNSAK